MQHVTRKVTIRAGIPNRPALQWDYWEAFRIWPNETKPDPLSLSDLTANLAWQRLRLRLGDKKASDWWTEFPGPNTSGVIEQKGDAFFLNAMDYYDLPAEWLYGHLQQAGPETPAIQTKGHEQLIQQVLEKYGKQKVLSYHEIKVGWGEMGKIGEDVVPIGEMGPTTRVAETSIVNGT